jgi:hypothetical protein
MYDVSEQFQIGSQDDAGGNGELEITNTVLASTYRKTKESHPHFCECLLSFYRCNNEMMDFLLFHAIRAGKKPALTFSVIKLGKVLTSSETPHKQEKRSYRL